MRQRKEGCTSPCILEDGSIECVAVNMLYPSRKRKNDPKGDSEVIPSIRRPEGAA